MSSLSSISSTSDVFGIAGVTFTVLGKTRSIDCEHAKPFVNALLLTNKKASLIFTNVVVYRSTVTRTNPIAHDLDNCFDKGPMTSEKFLKLMNFNPNMPNTDWHNYMIRCKLTEVKKAE